MSPALGSNAVTSVVAFYASALQETEARAAQAEALLKQATAAQHARAEWREFVERVRAAVLGEGSTLEKYAAVCEALEAFDGPDPLV